MVKVIDIKFSEKGKLYFFDPCDFTLSKGDKVVVNTSRGLELGFVADEPKLVDEEIVIKPLKKVLRIATTKDYDNYLSNLEKEKGAILKCEELALKCGLEMKIIGADFSLDSSKVIFSFTSDGRVDFRELVKELAAIYKMRIELKQIGLRDEAKIVGGVGCCGRTLCCQNWISEFSPVSIKMAKNQNLALNPSKISGSCGRLMCCLSYENETYTKAKKGMPKVGQKVLTDMGDAVVREVQLLQEKIICNLIDSIEDGEIVYSGDVCTLSKEEYLALNNRSSKKGNGPNRGRRDNKRKVN